MVSRVIDNVKKIIKVLNKKVISLLEIKLKLSEIDPLLILSTTNVNNNDTITNIKSG